LDDRVTKIRLGEERPAITGDQSGWVLVFGGRPGAMVRPEIASKSQEQAYKDSKRWEREALLPRHGWRGPR
jgi:hypothetical protein